MSEHLQFLLLGLGSGAVIASLALGLLLTYRASGVVNFAHAAMGMYVAYVFFELRVTGQLILPVIGVPGRVNLFNDPALQPTVATAMAIALACGALLGLVVYVLVFRPLRTAPALARVVASLGLFLYLLATVQIRMGSGNQSAVTGRPEVLLPSDLVSFGGIDIPADRLWLCVFVLAATALLGVVFTYSRFGLATRAAAENEKGAALIGLHPDRLAAVNWMVSAALAGAAVILIAPIAGLNPRDTSLLVVPALAAALMGGFRSFTITMLAGLGIGMLQSELINLQTEVDWLPELGWQQAVPFLLIIGTMIVRGETLPTRATLHEGRFPRSPRPRHLGVWVPVLTGAGAVLVLTGDSGLRQAVITSTVMAMIALSVVVLTGYVGQISLMPMALAGVAAFAMIRLSDDWGVPFPLSPVLAAAIAVAVGLVAGVPAVRVRGMNLAIATLAAAVAIEELVLKWGWFTGGLGGAEVPQPELFGVDLGITATGADFPRRAFGLLCLAALALMCVAVANLRRGGTGLRWLAVRANERAAASTGVDVTRTKLGAFAASAFLAGLGGTFLAYQAQTVSVGSFAVFNSLALLAMTYLGGIASIAGALIAGLLASGGVVTELTGGSSSETQFAVNGLVLMVVAVVYPTGLSGALYRLADRTRARWSPTAPPEGRERDRAAAPAPAAAQSPSG